MGKTLSTALKVLPDLEPKQVQEQEQQDDRKIIPLFFPSKPNEQKIMEVILSAKKEIRICVYTITNKNIIGAIEQVIKNKQISVRIITDDVQTKIPSQFALLKQIKSVGGKQIQIKLDCSPASLMHNKYLVIDRNAVITGSFNWTSKAVTTNKENIVIINDELTADEFIANFELLWGSFIEFTGNEVVQINDPLTINQPKQPKKQQVSADPRSRIVQKITKRIKKPKKSRNNNDSDYDPDTYSQSQYSDEDYDL